MLPPSKFCMGNILSYIFQLTYQRSNLPDRKINLGCQMFVVGLGGSAQRLQTTSGVGVLLLGLAGHDHLFTHKRSMCSSWMRAPKKQDRRRSQIGLCWGWVLSLLGWRRPWWVQTSWRPESRPTLGLLCKKEEQWHFKKKPVDWPSAGEAGLDLADQQNCFFDLQLLQLAALLPFDLQRPTVPL